MKEILFKPNIFREKVSPFYFFLKAGSGMIISDLECEDGKTIKGTVS